jgi:hypothetical protein
VNVPCTGGAGGRIWIKRFDTIKLVFSGILGMAGKKTNGKQDKEK